MPSSKHYHRRDGSVAVLLCFLLIPLLGLLALSVDYGFLLYVDTDLQRVADQAALAAVRELEPDSDGNQDLDRVRQVVREYVRQNAGTQFIVLDEDIEIGRFDPNTIYDSLTMLDNGIYDCVRITVRRSDLANASISLHFARIFGNNTANVNARAAAVLQKAKFLEPGTDILPIALSSNAWNSRSQSESWSVYGDGRLLDSNGDSIPGNWGTLDVGLQSNSSNDISNQIDYGLHQDDLNALYNDSRIDTPTHIVGTRAMWLNGDTGFSAGIKSAVRASHGKKKLVPIFDQSTGKGGNLEFHVVGWGVVEIVDSAWNGNKNSHLTIRKSYTYDSDLRPNVDLSDTAGVIQAAYTSPVLVQ
jgi:hypothetical protein